MREPSHHLLRVLAAVPVSSRILDLGCGDGVHAEALCRLGFAVNACDLDESAVATTRGRLAAAGFDSAADEVRQLSIGDFDYDPDTFDWIVAFRPESYVATPDDLTKLLNETRPLIKPGQWMYLALPNRDAFTPELLAESAEAAGWAEASAPEVVEEQGESLVRAIYRRVEPGTPR